jgi:5'-nucleotidase
MNLSLRFSWFIIGLTSFSACSTPLSAPVPRPPETISTPSTGVSDTQTGTQSVQEPSPSSSFETVVILGTNDLHGTLAPAIMKSREVPGVPSVTYESGGVTLVSAYVKKLKAEYSDHFIWLDGGDQFQGSIESNTELGKPMVDFFNTAGLNASAVGNHEFDFGLPNLKSRMREANYPYLAANIRDKSSQELAPFPNTSPSRIVKVGKLKMGVIGLSTEETPTTTRAINVQSLTFDSLKDATLREAKKLRDQGAQIIVIAAHAGVKCNPSKPELAGLRIRKPTDPQSQCNNEDEIVRLLKSLPEGTVDAVVSGHTHTVVHHWIGGIPVIQGGAFGKYINLIYLTYDWNRKKVRHEQTRIEGPIPVCSKVFENQKDCDGSHPAPQGGRGSLVVNQFHGEIIQPDPKMKDQVDLVIQKTTTVKDRQIGWAARPLDHQRIQESELGDVITDAMRKSTHSDVAYMNPGGVRAPIEMGKITYGDAFRSLPFDNTVAVVKMTGKELRTFIQIAQNGHHGLGSVSGLRLKLIPLGFDAPYDDVDGTGRFDTWKVNRLLDIRLEDGSPLKPEQIYTVATSDFLVTGGDDLGWIMAQIPEGRKDLTTHILLRETLVSYLQTSGPLNTPQHPVIDPEHPRITLESPKKKLKGHHRKSKRHVKLSS